MKLILALAVVVLLLSFATPVLAGNGEDLGDVVSFLMFVARGAAGGVVVSLLAGRSKWFEAQKSEVKFAIVAGISVVLPLLATLALNLVPSDIWYAIQPYWRAAVDGLLFTFGGSQVFHKLTKDT
jgi:hypothetical protein